MIDRVKKREEGRQTMPELTGVQEKQVMNLVNSVRQRGSEAIVSIDTDSGDASILVEAFRVDREGRARRIFAEKGKEKG